MFDILTELEETVLDVEGISAIMGMASDCAIEGTQLLDDFKQGL